MDLVIDANIVIAALIRRGFTLDIMFNRHLNLLIPEMIFAEIKKHKSLIIRKSKISSLEYNLFMAFIDKRLNIVPLNEYRRLLKKADKICPDPDDFEYFAVALAKGVPLWSNERCLKKQKKVLVLTTREITDKIKKLDSIDDRIRKFDETC